MDQAQMWATILSSATGATVVREVITGLVRWKNGSARRQRGYNDDIVKQRDQAYHSAWVSQSRAEYEARQRQRIEEYAHQLRILLIQRGISMPDWPTAPEPEEDPYWTASRLPRR